jgi:hypothetical protein
MQGTSLIQGRAFVKWVFWKLIMSNKVKKIFNIYGFTGGSFAGNITHPRQSFMKNDIVLVPYEETDGMIFCGYFEGHLLLKNGNPLLSRTHKQPYRIYHANGISQAMAASETQGRYFIMENMADQNAIELPSELKGKKFRIRKLTPRECFRLMGVDDKDIDKIQAAGVSNSAQYKLAGNSIVVDTLFHLFRKMFIEKENESGQLSLF